MTIKTTPTITTKMTTTTTMTVTKTRNITKRRNQGPEGRDAMGREVSWKNSTCETWQESIVIFSIIRDEWQRCQGHRKWQNGEQRQSQLRRVWPESIIVLVPLIFKVPTWNNSTKPFHHLVWILIFATLVLMAAISGVAKLLIIHSLNPALWQVDYLM